MKIGLYKHYKGKYYQVIGVCKHSETQEDLVLYEALYENEISKLWVRPIGMFLESVVIDGKKVSRFQYVGDKKSNQRL
jgi:hypothetical protein